MKNTMKIFAALFAAILMLPACSDMLKVDPDNISFDNKLDSPNDTIYSMVGILSRLQSLGDRYVILGELRGDLMTTTPSSVTDLQDISNFDIKPGNAYIDVKPYYEIINNCNYYIQKVDTSLMAKGKKVMLPEFAAAKAIRAWAYLQLVLNYKTATYFEQPILNLESSLKSYPEYGLDEIADKLIADLLPYQSVQVPSYGDIDYNASSRFFIQIPFLLGDLYLWKGNYEQAAQQYYYLMQKRGYVVDNNQQFIWTNPSFSFQKSTSSGAELVTMIPFTADYGKNSKLYDLTHTNFQLTPSKLAVSNWDNQIYTYYSEASNGTVTKTVTTGDLRGDGQSIFRSSYYNGSQLQENDVITKYKSTSSKVNLYRVGLLYLRYAEAVNRIGKPSLAFAVLKYGLSAKTLADATKVAPGDLLPSQSYFNFTSSVYDNSIGVHARGCGQSEQDQTYKITVVNKTKSDSVLSVEKMICDELALETAFEGNRFHDLMRIAFHREKDQSGSGRTFLADAVAQKYGNSDYAVFYQKLLDENNWYIPYKK